MTRLRAVVGARTAASVPLSEEGPSIPRHRCSRPTRDEPPTLRRRGAVGGRAGAHDATTEGSSPGLRRHFRRQTRGPSRIFSALGRRLGQIPMCLRPGRRQMDVKWMSRREDVPGDFAERMPQRTDVTPNGCHVFSGCCGGPRRMDVAGDFAAAAARQREGYHRIFWLWGVAGGRARAKCPEIRRARPRFQQANA